MVEGLRHPMARYCLDGAVSLFGTIVENALLERREVAIGSAKKTVARWTLKEILDPAFTLPRDGEGDDSLDTLKGIGGGFYDEVS